VGYAFGSTWDWVGLYCGNEPIVSAPLKFRTLGSSSNGSNVKEGTMLFYVENARVDCQFALVNGGSQFPLVAGLSNPIKFKSPSIPLGVRTAMVESGVGSEIAATTSLRVSWNGAEGGRPALRWSTKAAPAADADNIVPATTGRITAQDMCGEPASGSGWHDPGVFYSAIITDLPYGTSIQYAVGDLDVATSDTRRWTSLVTLTTPPKPGTILDSDDGELMFLAFGDMGQAPVNGSQQHSWDYGDHGEINALNSTRRMIGEMHSSKPPSFVMHIGDIAYSVGFLSEWAQFTEQIRPVAEKIPWMTAMGNHEMGFENSFFAGTDSGGECGVPYSAYFQMPAPANSFGPDQPWYSFRFGPVAFVVMSTEHNFTAGSPQLQFIEQALKSVDRSVTPYLVFTGHRPMYVDSNWDGDDTSDQAVSRLLRATVEPLLLEAKVDLCMWGHHHTYQRTQPVFNATVNPEGPTHVVIGMAGYDLTHDFYPEMLPYFAYRTDKHWGYTRVRVNSTHLRMQFVADDGGDILDDFSLPKRSFANANDDIADGRSGWEL